MQNFGALFRLPTTLLFCLPLFSTVLLASPSIDVNLEASFSAPPFLVELLYVRISFQLFLHTEVLTYHSETAASENQTAYLPLLDTIASGRFSSADSDEQLYTQFIQALQDDGHITDFAAISSFKFALAVHEAAPRVEAHYQFWRSTSEIYPEAGTVKQTIGVEIWQEDGTLCLDAGCKEISTGGSVIGAAGGHGFHT